MDASITDGQLKRLQTLYGQLARHTDVGADRASRLAWASELLRRPVVSFSSLTHAEAIELTDTLQGQLGIAQTKPARGRRLDREAARKAGTEGRRGSASNETTMAGPAEFARIQYALDLLGWNQAQLEGWLRSPSSPLRKAAPQIRTLGDANRVWWALKKMAVKRGLWKVR